MNISLQFLRRFLEAFHSLYNFAANEVSLALSH